MATMFDDMMNGLDEVDAFLAEAASQTPEDQQQLIQEPVTRSPNPATSEPKHNIMEFCGLGAEIWEGIDAQDYVHRERASWDS